MNEKVIKGSVEISKMIKDRRKELGLTIEEAASLAGVGTKTWCRYEAGESIRKDKVRGICKALNWRTFLNEENGELEVLLEEYKRHEAWSEWICDCYGEAAAISFVIGSDILLDYINEELKELSRLPRDSHIGQLPFSMMKDRLPEQFLTRYDYEFLYCLKCIVLQYRGVARGGRGIVAHRVIDELVLYLIVEEARFSMENILDKLEQNGIEDVEIWDEWIFDMLGDMDVVTFLFSDRYLTHDWNYHFDHWLKEQFYLHEG